jgi:glycosyltransferase involved in cell wall biosynthesis
MVRDRDDVDVLVELSERNVNVARNAGINAATGDVVAIVSYDRSVEDGWLDGLTEALADGARVVTGPTHRELRAGVTTEDAETRTIAGREVTYFNPDNVAFDRDALDDLDGFDERLALGGARDAAHRLGGMDQPVSWESAMSVRCAYSTDGGHSPEEWGEKYRSLTYRLCKNYGVRPTVFRRTVGHAVRDAYENGREVVAGDGKPTAWFANGKRVVRGIAAGAKAGLAARAKDRTPRRNPFGVSARNDRAVTKYDYR